MKFIARAIPAALLVVSGASGRVVDENKLRNNVVPHGVRRLYEAGATDASPSRTTITVEYEFQLETFDQSSTGSTADVLEEMDHIVLSVMQQLLHSNKLNRRLFSFFVFY